MRRLEIREVAGIAILLAIVDFTVNEVGNSWGVLSREVI